MSSRSSMRLVRLLLQRRWRLASGCAAGRRFCPLLHLLLRLLLRHTVCRLRCEAAASGGAVATTARVCAHRISAGLPQT